MAVTSEFTDEFDGGGPNKKPQEPQKNPKQEEEEEEEEENRIVSFELLPDILQELCVGRVSRSDYTAVSLTSKFFRRLINSSGLELTRSKFALTERVLYALIGFPPAHFPSWFVLNQGDSSSLRLRRVTALRPMPFGSAVVTVGSVIYVFGGRDVDQRNKPDVFAIDCIDHKRRELPRMEMSRCGAAAGVIDGKIYVVGGCHRLSAHWVETFDLKKGTWVRKTNSLRPSFVDREFVTYAVMEEKIYALSRESCYVYEPKEDICTPLDHGRQLRRFWHASSCVVDGLLYTIDPWCSLGQPLVVYDPKKMEWEPVNLEGRRNALTDPRFLWYYESKMVSLDRKLVLLVGNRSRWWNCYGEKHIFRVQIALERLEGGGIRGNVESVDVVLTSTISPPAIELCVAVTV